MSNTINADNGVVSTVPGLKYSADTSGELILQTNTTNALTLDTTQGATFSTGALVTNPYAGSYSGGMVLDHTTSLGRISVAASSAIAFYNGGISARVETMRITSTGNVGIGTGATINNVATGQTILELSGANYALINLSTANVRKGYLYNDNTNVWLGAASATGVLRFDTVGTERMRIDSSGNVGIGTTTPLGSYNAALAVVSPNTFGTITAKCTATTGAAGVFVQNDANTADCFMYAFNSASGSLNASIGTSKAQPLALFTNNSEKMRITSAGNVGIGTGASFGVAGLASSQALDILGGVNLLGFGNNVYLTANAWYNSNWTYKNSSASSAIVVQGDGNIVFNNAASGTAGNTFSFSERMRIDSSGNVGVGITPSAWSSGSTAIQNPAGSIWRFSNNIYLGNNYYWNGSNRIYVNSAEASEYELSNGIHRWYTAPSGTAGNAVTLTERLRLNSNGALILSGGSTTASGVGITFPATQSASSDANTLDDYEEGNWTPTLSSQGGALTTASATGTYIKIGKLVTITGRAILTNVGTATGQLNVGGLPFIAQNSTGTQTQNGVVREAASTGLIYFMVVINNSNSAAIQNSTNGGVAYQNGYVYDFTDTYISA